MIELLMSRRINTSLFYCIETLIHKGVTKFTFYMYIRQDIQILYSRSKVGREEGNGII